MGVGGWWQGWLHLPVCVHACVQVRGHLAGINSFSTMRGLGIKLRSSGFLAVFLLLSHLWLEIAFLQEEAAALISLLSHQAWEGKCYLKTQLHKCDHLQVRRRAFTCPQTCYLLSWTFVHPEISCIFMAAQTEQ